MFSALGVGPGSSQVISSLPKGAEKFWTCVPLAAIWGLNGGFGYSPAFSVCLHLFIYSSILLSASCAKYWYNNRNESKHSPQKLESHEPAGGKNPSDKPTSNWQGSVVLWTSPKWYKSLPYLVLGVRGDYPEKREFGEKLAKWGGRRRTFQTGAPTCTKALTRRNLLWLKNKKKVTMMNG